MQEAQAVFLLSTIVLTPIAIAVTIFTLTQFANPNPEHEHDVWWLRFQGLKVKVESTPSYRMWRRLELILAVIVAWGLVLLCAYLFIQNNYIETRRNSLDTFAKYFTIATNRDNPSVLMLEYKGRQQVKLKLTSCEVDSNVQSITTPFGFSVSRSFDAEVDFTTKKLQSVNVEYLERQDLLLKLADLQSTYTSSGSAFKVPSIEAVTKASRSVNCGKITYTIDGREYEEESTIGIRRQLGAVK